MNWLPWLIIAAVALLFWRDIRDRSIKLYGDLRGTAGTVKSALGGKVAMLLIGITLGAFTPQAIAWVREHGWTWPDIPNIIVPAEGKRQAYIVRESESDNPDFAILAVQLRNGVNADYLKSKGHTLTIHDDDDVDASGVQPPVLAANKPFTGTELLIFDGERLLKREACPTTANGVIEAIKRSGG